MDKNKIVLRVRTKFSQLRFEVDPSKETLLGFKKKICDHLLDNGEDIEPKQITLHIDDIENEQIRFQDTTLIQDVQDLEGGTMIYIKMKKEISLKVFYINDNKEQHVSFMLNYKKETLKILKIKISEHFQIPIEKIVFYSDSLCQKLIEEPETSKIGDIPFFQHGAGIYCKQQQQLVNQENNQSQSSQSQNQPQQQQQSSLYEQLLNQTEFMDEEQQIQMLMNEQEQQQQNSTNNNSQFSGNNNQNNLQKQQQKMEIENQQKQQQEVRLNPSKNIRLRIRTSQHGQIFFSVDINNLTFQQLKEKIGMAIGQSGDQISIHLDQPQNKPLQYDSNTILNEIEGLNEEGEIIYIRNINPILINVKSQYASTLYDIDLTKDNWKTLKQKIAKDLSVGFGESALSIIFDIFDEQNQPINIVNLNNKLEQYPQIQHGNTIIIQNIQSLQNQQINLRIKSTVFGQYNFNGLKNQSFQDLKQNISNQFGIEPQSLDIGILNDDTNQICPINDVKDDTLLQDINNLQNGQQLVVKDKNYVDLRFQRPQSITNTVIPINPKKTTFMQLKQQISSNLGIMPSNLILSIQQNFSKIIEDSTKIDIELQEKRNQLSQSVINQYDANSAHPNLIVTDKVNILYKKNNLNTNQICVLKKQLTEDEDFGFWIKSNGYVGIGVCHKQIVQQNRYIIKPQEHGMYMLTSDSIQYNHKGHINVRVSPQMRYGKNDIVRVKYDKKESFIEISIFGIENRNLKIKVDNSLPLYPCFSVRNDEQLQYFEKYSENFQSFLQPENSDQKLVSQIQEFSFKCTYYVEDKNKFYKNQQQQQQNTQIPQQQQQNQQQNDQQEQQKIKTLYSHENSNQKMEEEEEKNNNQMVDQLNSKILLRFKSQFGQFRFQVQPYQTTLIDLKNMIVDQNPNFVKSKMALFIEDFDEQPIGDSNSTILSNIENIEDGTLIFIKDVDIFKLKVEHQNIQHIIDIDPKKCTSQQLQQKIQTQLAIKNAKISLDSVQVFDKKLVKNVFSLNKDTLLKLQIIENIDNTNQMEEEQEQKQAENIINNNDIVTLRFRSDKGQFNKQVNKQQETFLSLKLMISEQQGQKLEDIALQIEEQDNQLDLDDDIPLLSVEGLENGTILYIKDKNAYTLFYVSASLEEYNQQQQIQQSKKDKIVYNPNTYTFYELKNHIIRWLGLDPKFTTLHLDSPESEIIEKQIKKYLQEQQNQQQQQQQQGEQNTSNIEQEPNTQQQLQQQDTNNNNNLIDLEGSDQDDENLYDDGLLEQNQDFNDDYDEDDEGEDNNYGQNPNIRENNSYFPNFNNQQANRNLNEHMRNMRNILQNNRYDQYDQSAHNSRNQQQQNLDLLTINKLEFIKNNATIYAKNNAIKLYLGGQRKNSMNSNNNINQQQQIIINPLNTSFKQLLRMVARQLRMDVQFIALHIDDINSEPIEVAENILIKDIPSIKNESILYTKNYFISVRVQSEWDEDQYEFFNVNLRSQTFGQFKNIVAAWQGLNSDDFTLHFEDAKNPEIVGDFEQKVGEMDFIKNLQMTSKIFVKEKEDLQNKFIQKKYNQKQCRIIMEKQTKIINRYNEMYFHNRNKITAVRDDFLPNLYKELISQKQKRVQIPEKVYSGSKVQPLLDQSQKNGQTLGHIIAITFDKEYGLDWGGVTDDFFSLFQSELLDHDKNKQLRFLESNNLIHPTSYVNSEMPNYYRFIGRMFGLLFRHRKNCGVRLHPIFYKMLGMTDEEMAEVKVVVRTKQEEQQIQQKKSQFRQQKMELENYQETQQYESDSDDNDDYEFGDSFEVTIEDVKDFDQGQYKSLKCYLDGKDTIDWEDQYLDFHIFDEVTKELKPLGNDGDKEVNKDTIVEYVKLSIEYYLKIECLQQMAQGFHDVIPARVLTQIGNFGRWEPIADLIEGSNVEISVALLQNNVAYEGYDEKHPTIQLFWEALQTDFNEKERRQLLYYITGKKKLPLNGFKAFKDSKLQKINITYEQNENRLPEGHTCFHQLILPAYTQKDQLVKKVKMAMKQEAMYIV